MLWGHGAKIKACLPLTHVIHMLSHQHVGIHVVGNSMAEEVAKATVQIAVFAAITRSSMRIDGDSMAAVNCECDSTHLRKGFPTTYSYQLSLQNIPFAHIPVVGDRVTPNSDRRLELILAAHEDLASAHTVEAATILLLQQHYWWPGLYK